MQVQKMLSPASKYVSSCVLYTLLRPSATGTGFVLLQRGNLLRRGRPRRSRAGSVGRQNDGQSPARARVDEMITSAGKHAGDDPL
jgi:hypothetical protein